MPSKIQLDENLWFLYICLQKSDLKAIDFNAVGLATSLKPPAARMRYTRLRRQIESGALNTTHGPGFSSSSPPAPSSPTLQSGSESTPALAANKRKRGKKSQDRVITASATAATITKNEAGEKQKAQEKTAKTVKSIHTPGDEITGREVDKTFEESKGEEKKDRKIKLEDHSGSDADFDSDSEDDEDSEDEMPLAKLQKRRGLGMGSMPPPLSVSSTASISGRAPVSVPALSTPAYSTYATSHSFGYGPGAPGSGNRNMMETPRYVPQGFNTLAIGSGNGRGIPNGRSFGASGSGGVHGRSLYASPYAGWIDGRGHEDQMGNPGPGWEHRARFREQQYQNQPQGLERGQDVGSEVPRKSV